MFTNPDSVYDVRRAQMQDILSEAQQDQLAQRAQESSVNRAPRLQMLTAIRRTLGVWLVALGERIEGVSSTPEVGSDAATA